jgi:hypothetical protein
MSERENFQQRPVWQDLSAIAGMAWINNYCKRLRRDRSLCTVAVVACRQEFPN